MKTFKIGKPSLLSILILIIVFTLSVGYAEQSITGTMENIMASIKPIADARITGIEISSVSNGGISHSEDYNKDSIFGLISLPSQDSSVTYKVDVTVFLSSEMRIHDMTGLDSRLEYELTDYAIDDILCDAHNECNLGARDEFYITIKYKENAYDGVTTDFPYKLDFTFARVDKVAKIGTTYYEKLQDAINAVPTTGAETTIRLIKNTSELLTTAAGQNIVFDFQNFTVSNIDTKPIIENYGNIKITNGTLSTDATQGAINVYAGGSLLMTGGSIISTGTKQAIFVSGGSATITGDAYLRNTSNQRAAVQNESGTLIITGGTIISERFYGVHNKDTMTIGVKDGNVDASFPEIQGTYGVFSTTNFNFYDGILKGKTNAINDITKLQDKEVGYGILYGTEDIEGTTYKTAILEHISVVRFDANGGTVSEAERIIKTGTAIGALPIPTLTGYTFDGWFTTPSGGTEITSSSVITADIDCYAHWTENTEVFVAKIGMTEYHTLAEAITAAPPNTETTIQFIRNSIETVTIPNNKNIILDLQTYTLTSPDNSAVIVNNGRIKLISGTIQTNSASTSAVNNNSAGHFTMTGGSIIATGQRQAVYNDGGRVSISGTAFLKASTGVRATVQNLNNGTITITGGTIQSVNQEAVKNAAGTLTIGSKDGTIDITTPVLIGATNGVNNASTFNFYDGILKGKVDAISGTVADKEAGSSITTSTEVIDGITYQTAYLSH